MSDWILALGLVFVIEGTLWAVFSHQMRGMLLDLLQRDPGQLRVAGTVILAVGVAIVWLVKG